MRVVIGRKKIIIWPVKRCHIGIFHIGKCHLDIVDTVDTVDTADIVHTVDTLDNVKSVNSVDNVSSVNSVHNVHNVPNDAAARGAGRGPINVMDLV